MKKVTMYLLFMFFLLNIFALTGCDSSSDDEKETSPYQVSGTISLPVPDSLTGGSYDIAFNENHAYGEWTGGNTQDYSINLEPGNYDNVSIYVYDDDEIIQYSFNTISADVTVTDSDLSGIDFTVNAYVLYTVSGSIILPEGYTLTDGYCEMAFEGIKFATGATSSGIYGNSLDYSEELEPGVYDVTIYIFNGSGTPLYSYHAADGVTVTDSDLTDVDFTVVPNSTDNAGTDSYEPDNDYGSATSITVGAAAQDHTLHVSEDEDWFSFAGISGLTYTISVSGSDHSIDMWLYGSGDLSNYIDYEFNSPITFECTETGTYYIQVMGFISCEYSITLQQD